MAFNVLVVDDSAVMRQMVVRTLRMSGVPLGQIFEAGNGEQGLHTLQEQWVDLLLLDINMPVMNGEEMLETLRRNPLWADLAVVVVSTEGSQTRIERLQQLRVHFIRKPFAPETIQQVLALILGESHAERA